MHGIGTVFSILSWSWAWGRRLRSPCRTPITCVRDMSLTRLKTTAFAEGQAHSPNAFFFSIYVENCLSSKVPTTSRLRSPSCSLSLHLNVQLRFTSPLRDWRGNDAYRLNRLSFNKLLPAGSINCDGW